MYAVTLPPRHPLPSPSDWAAASAGFPRSPARPPRGFGGCVTYPALAPARAAAAAAREEAGKPLAECRRRRAVFSMGRGLVPAPEGGGSAPKRACPRRSSEWGCCWAASPGKSSPEGLLHFSTSRQPRALLLHRVTSLWKKLRSSLLVSKVNSQSSFPAGKVMWCPFPEHAGLFILHPQARPGLT